MKNYIVCYRELNQSSSNQIHELNTSAYDRTDAILTAKHTIREFLGHSNFTLWVYAYKNKKSGNLHCFCTYDGKEK